MNSVLRILNPFKFFNFFFSKDNINLLEKKKIKPVSRISAYSLVSVFSWL